MSEISLVTYQPGWFERWNRFVEGANNGTIFHRLDFLAYHGDRFKEFEHHLVWLKGEEILAVMPMAIFEEGGKKIACSPFGASWGGIVVPTRLTLKYALELTERLRDYLIAEKVDRVIITMPPPCYYQTYNAYVEFALAKSGFHLSNRDLTGVVEIPFQQSVEMLFKSSGRNQSRKARKAGIVIGEDQDLDKFYEILLEDKARHGATATHTLNDLKYLKNIFPNRIRADLAYLKGRAIAGIMYFTCNRNCELTFYMAQRTDCRTFYPMNLLAVEGIARAQKEGFKFFDFGTLTLNMQIGNIGVAHFKENFGALGQFRETYILKI